jgi:hypothetical protein
VIFVLLWRRRSTFNLPLVMLFPWNAILAGVGVVYIPAQTGDYYNIMALTGLPGWALYAAGLLLVLLGIHLFMSVLPLAGLAPTDGRSLLAVPAALLLWSLISLPVAYLVVPGSPIDVRFGLGEDTLMTARMTPILAGVMGVLIGALYVSLYRWLQPRLPARLRSDMVDLAWRDLRLPAVLCGVSVIAGLAIIA